MSDSRAINEADKMENAQLKELSTAALQAHERLHLAVKKQNTSSPRPSLLSQSIQTLQNLREMKSLIEGTSVEFEKVILDEKLLQDIKQIILMHVPSSLNPDIKSGLTDKICEAFKGSCQKVLFAALLTCPWYCATQEERGQQAKHNSVIVVYQSKNTQFFSPINPHNKEQDSEVIDHGWLYAVEAFHFASYLVKGKSRLIEAMSLPDEAIIYASEEWNMLLEIVSLHSLQRLRGFLEQLRIQAVGSVSRKSKSGKMCLRDGATLYEFCESFRLLGHATHVLSGKELSFSNPSQSALEDVETDAILQLCDTYQEDRSVTKEDLLSTLMSWRSLVDHKMTNVVFTNVKEVEGPVGHWLSELRTGPNFIPIPLAVTTGQEEKLRALLASVGGPVSKMDPAQILMVAQAGSFLYGLATPESDVDYLVIYAHPVQDVLGATKRLSESLENRGPRLKVEYGAYEARLFCEMLWKGSVVITEVAFVEEVEYMSKHWKDLISHKHLFATERLILQYFGLIKNNMNMIKDGKHKDMPREKKIFYQIFHKLFSLEDLLQFHTPRVKMTGQNKEFIMRIRKGPLEGDLSKDKLFEQANNKIEQIKHDLANRTRRLPENVDFTFLTNWLLSVRGWRI